MDVVGLEEVEDDDGHIVVEAQGEGGGIHNAELLLQGFEVGDFLVAFGFGILFGIAVVNAVDLGGFEDDVGADFIGA